MNIIWETERPKLSAYEEQRLQLSLEMLKDVNPEAIIFHTVILTDDLSGPSVLVFYQNGSLRARYTSKTERETL